MASPEPVPATGEPSAAYSPVPPMIFTHSRRTVPRALITWLRPSLPTMVAVGSGSKAGARSMNVAGGPAISSPSLSTTIVSTRKGHGPSSWNRVPIAGSSALTMASRSWPHGMTTTLSLVVVVPVGAPVVLVPVVLEVLAAVPVVVPVVSVVPVVVSAVEVAVTVIPVVLVVPVVVLVGLVVVSGVPVMLVPVVCTHSPGV